MVLFRSVFSTPAKIENTTVLSEKMEKSEISLSSEYIIVFISLVVDKSSITVQSKD